MMHILVADHLGLHLLGDCTGREYNTYYGDVKN
jgi:hypothetical protein